MKTVMDYFRLPPRYQCAGDIGVEIEVEGENIPMATRYWRNEKDGSLRGESREFVLEKPSTMKEVQMALKYLNLMYKKHNTVVHDSIRAGVHVHINAQKLTIIELYNFMTVYLVLEELLTEFCGEHRKGNLFCLRAGDAEVLISSIKRAARTGMFRDLVVDELRYSAMNVKALGTYGSLEFRAMRGTRDLGLVEKWAEILLNLREVSKKFADPTEVMQYYSAGNIKEFVIHCLGDNAEIFLAMPDYEAKVKAGMRLSQEVAYCVDWGKYIEKPTKLVGGLVFPVDIDFPDEPFEDF